MNLLGVDKITFGVEDLELCKKFWRDFGLTEIANTPGHGLYECASKAQVEVRRIDDASLPPPAAPGSTVRETVWAAGSPAALDAIAGELATDRDVARGPGGSVHALDPEGYGIGFRLNSRLPVAEPRTLYNAPGRADRIDAQAIFYGRATPQHLAHVVFHVSDLAGTAAFYRDRLGFRISDGYPGRGTFLRCAGAIDHHNLFLLHAGPAKGFHHCAFEVRDIHEVFGGGLSMNDLGWNTHLGPGRHNVTSAYFWYFKNPSGGAAEYGFDTDRVTDAWQPREIEPTDGAFAEWSLEEGMARFAGLQRGVERQDG